MFRIESCAKRQVRIDDLSVLSWKGRLLRFEPNSAATSDGSTQKLGNDVRRDSELIATKVCSQISRN